MSTPWCRQPAFTMHGPALAAVLATAFLLLGPVEIVFDLALERTPAWFARWLESGVEDGAGGGTDKLLHLVLFFLLTALVYRSLSARWPVFARRPLLCAMATTIYGGFLEVLQGLQPARSAEFWDGVADGIGALLSVGSIHLLRLSRSVDSTSGSPVP